MSNGTVISQDTTNIAVVQALGISVASVQANTATSGLFSLPIATSAILGGVKIPSDSSIVIDESGNIDVEIGEGLKKDIDGTISVNFDDITIDIDAKASVDNNSGTPSVTVTEAVVNGKTTFTFNFKNLKGAKGDAFEYSDFTTTQLQSLKGEDGDSAYDIWLSEGNSGTESEFIASLKGKDGEAPTISIGSVSTGAVASATITKDNSKENGYILNLVIPQSNTGSGGGGTGGNAVSPTISVTETPDGFTITVVDVNGQQSPYYLKHGTSPDISETVNVTTLNNNQNATASFQKDGSGKYVLNLGIPKGKDGTNSSGGTTTTGGIFVGSGDMPDGYNVQIDPNGIVGDISTLAEEVFALIPNGNEVAY